MPKAKQNIELSLAQKVDKIDIEKITAEVTEKITKQVEAQLTEQVADMVTEMNKFSGEIEGKLQVALGKINSASEQRREKITLTSEHQFSIEANLDGLMFAKEGDPILMIGKNGQLGSGTRAPRSFGRGSAHFKCANYSSEAILPSVGDGVTRGVLIESDGDDDKSFSLRAVSRMNRQGFNVFSDGSLGINKFKKNNNETLSVYHKQADGDVMSLEVPSKDFTGSVLKIDANPGENKGWKAISVNSNNGENDLKTETFRVNGQGDVFAGGTLFNNASGYSEFFEWEDGNARDEDRNGFTVTVTEEGKIRVADDDNDAILGVIVERSAFASNTKWNHWRNKYFQDLHGKRAEQAYEIVEWMEAETSTMKSFYKDGLDPKFALPENACIIETDEDGNEMKRPLVNSAYEYAQEYEGRQDRQGWAMVCVLGTIPIFKGQVLNKNWIKIKDLSDEMELVLIR